MKKYFFAVVAVMALSLSSVFAGDAPSNPCGCSQSCVAECCCKPSLREKLATARAERAEVRAERLACYAAKLAARKCCETEVVVVLTVKLPKPCCCK